jgi:hypothetical protein
MGACDPGCRRLLLRSAPGEGGRIGPIFDPTRLRRILTNLEKRGVVVDSGPDAVRLLDQQQAGAMYMADHGRPGVLLLRPGATRLEVLEELVHHGQHVRAKYLLPQETIALALIQVERELEAQGTLLAIARRRGWTAEEIAMIERNQGVWQELHDRLVQS